MIKSSIICVLGCLVAVVSLGILGVDCRFGGLASGTVDVVGADLLAFIKDSESTKSKCSVLWDAIYAFIDGDCGAEMFLQTVEHYAYLGNGDGYYIGKKQKFKMSSVCRLHSGQTLEQFQLTNSIRFPTKWSKVKMTVADISALSKQRLNQITILPKQRQFLFDSRDRFRKLWEKHFPGKDSAERLDVTGRDMKSILLQFCDWFQSGVSKDSKEGKSEFTKYALPRYYSLVGMTGIVGEERGNFLFQLNNCLLDSDGYLTVRWNTGKDAEVVCQGRNEVCNLVLPEAKIPGYFLPAYSASADSISNVASDIPPRYSDLPPPYSA